MATEVTFPSLIKKKTREIKIHYDFVNIYENGDYPHQNHQILLKIWPVFNKNPASTLYTHHPCQSVKSGTFYEVLQAGRRGRIKYLRSTEIPAAVNSWVRNRKDVLLIEDLTARIYMGQDITDTGRMLVCVCKCIVEKVDRLGNQLHFRKLYDNE